LHEPGIKEPTVMKPMLENEKNKRKKRKEKDLESKGYNVGSGKEFLGLSTEESKYIEVRMALSEAIA